MNWEQIKQIAAAGHEIGNHSMTHYRLTRAKTKEALVHEIIEPIAIIEKHVGIRPLTFCYPGNNRNEEIIAIAESAHIGSTNCRRYFYGGENFNLEKQKGWLEAAIKSGEAHHAMFHGIVEGEGWEPLKGVDVFEAILQNIQAKETDLWICTFADLCKYQRLRDSAQITYNKNNGFTISCEDKFNYPLTIKINPVPEGLSPIQNGKPLSIFHSNSKNYLDVIPGNGPVYWRQ